MSVARSRLPHTHPNRKRRVVAALLALTLLPLAAFAVDPLPLPEEFDPEANLMGEAWHGRSYHSVRHSARLAEELVANGAPEDIAVAERILDVVLACQSRNPEDAHYGNYLWMLESPIVQDLNAVAFTQRYLIPLAIRHRDRLSTDTRERLLESIRLGTQAIRRMDVAVTYTNVAAMHILSACLGGEVLGDADMAAYGYDKMARFAAQFAENGTVYEFNSPGYVRVTTDALDRLADLVEHEPTRVRARAMLARIGLSTALRIHRPSGYLTGPNSRSKYSFTVCDGDPEIGFVREWIAEGVVPVWIEAVLVHDFAPGQIDETASARWRLGTAAYVSDSFVMGLATREISRQTNVFTAHCRVPGEERPAALLSRYLIDDTWFGDPMQAADRGNRPGLSDAGKFLGVQSGPRVIGLYAPRTLQHPDSLSPASQNRFRSAKAVLVWSPHRAIDGVWIDEEPAEIFPADVPPGSVVVVAMGDALTAIQPLTISDLGYGAPVRLNQVGDELVLEMYNYLGPEKVFWNMEPVSRFYQGEVQCGFYAELAERSDYPDGAAFAKAVASGTVTDTVDAAFTTYLDLVDGKRVWSVEYVRDGEALGIEIDLMHWDLLKRWTHEEELGWPMLESPVARQNATGRVTVGNATLRCGKHPAWLYANPEARLWVAGYSGDAKPLKLELPEGSVRVKAMGTGTVVWDKGIVHIDAVGLRGPVKVKGGTLAE